MRNQGVGAERIWNLEAARRAGYNRVEAEAFIKVLEHYGAHLRETDRWQTCQCISPDHIDRHRSARVHLAEEAYICNGCGLKAGDAITLISKLEGVSRDSAVNIYQQITGNIHPRQRYEQQQQRRKGIDLSGRPRDYEHEAGLLRGRVYKNREMEDDSGTV